MRTDLPNELSPPPKRSLPADVSTIPMLASQHRWNRQNIMSPPKTSWLLSVPNQRASIAVMTLSISSCCSGAKWTGGKPSSPSPKASLTLDQLREEEGRVGKEGVGRCKSRWWPYH